MIAFGIGMLVVGAGGLIFRRGFGEASARVFKGNGWVGLQKSAVEWTRVQTTIGVMFLMLGAALVILSLFGPGGLI